MTHPTEKLLSVPEGWQLVPIEPTPEMKTAGERWSGLPGSTWADMLDAAPEPPRSEQEAETAQPERIFVRFVRGDAFGQEANQLRIRKWATKNFDGAGEYVLSAAHQGTSDALKLVVAYDDLLRRYEGLQTLFAGDVMEIDRSYDKMVAACRAALATEGNADA